MNRSVPWGWIALAAFLLLLPGPLGRLVLDLIGGFTLLLLLLPLIGAAAFFLGWQWLRSRMRQCPACGFTSLGSSVCPACGSAFVEAAPSPDGFSAADPDASRATITVEAVAVTEPPTSDS